MDEQEYADSRARHSRVQIEGADGQGPVSAQGRCTCAHTMDNRAPDTVTESYNVQEEATAEAPRTESQADVMEWASTTNHERPRVRDFPDSHCQATQDVKVQLFTKDDELEEPIALVATRVCGAGGPTAVAVVRNLEPAPPVETTWTTQHRMLFLFVSFERHTRTVPSRSRSCWTRAHPACSLTRGSLDSWPTKVSSSIGEK